MTRRPARVTQAEINRVYRVAKADGKTVKIEDGVIYIVPLPEEGSKTPEVEDTRRIVF